MSVDYNIINWGELVYYDETSPTFLRRRVESRAGKYGNILRIAVGGISGYIARNGYAITGFLGKRYLNHRIIWTLFNATIDPDLQVDHIDGNRCNNRIENLRLVPREINQRNTSVRYNNATGVVGVCMVNINGSSYYVAQWYNLAGRMKQKYFSILKLGEVEAFRLACELRQRMVKELNEQGEVEAFRLACELRQRMVKELNEQGAGYTERHGT